MLLTLSPFDSLEFLLWLLAQSATGSPPESYYRTEQATARRSPGILHRLQSLPCALVSSSTSGSDRCLVTPASQLDSPFERSASVASARVDKELSLHTLLHCSRSSHSTAVVALGQEAPQALQTGSTSLREPPVGDPVGWYTGDPAADRLEMG